MAKGSKKGNGDNKKKKNSSNQAQKSKVKLLCRPQSGDARKMKSTNEVQELPALSWNSKEVDDESHESLAMELSNQDKANFEAARTRLSDWIASVQTPIRHSGPGIVQPSPHPMQNLNSNPGTDWNKSLFGHIREEGLDLTQPVNSLTVDPKNMVKITSEDVIPEIEYWSSAIVCYIMGVKPPFRIIDGFIHRVWGKFGVTKVSMMSNGVFVVRFRNKDEMRKAINAEPILFDRKPVIMKEWTPDLDLLNANIKIVPTWIRLPRLPLKY